MSIDNVKDAIPVKNCKHFKMMHTSRRICHLFCKFKGRSSLQYGLQVPKRCMRTAQAENVNLWQEYERAKKHKLSDQHLMSNNRDPTAVYANNEVNLDEVEVYGFDYDYTLASYTDALHELIYNMGREALVQLYKYPAEVEYLSYNPHFAVRGLHCDVQQGFLLKIDAFHNIQMGTVYKGLQQVSDKDVKDHYHGTHVPIDNMSSFYGSGAKMHQLMDLFALPEMNLYANVIEYFTTHDIDHDPEYVFFDVRNAVQGLHSSGLLHEAILKNLDKYIGHQPDVAQLLQQLVEAGKKLFLITNSAVNFVDRGMTYLVGPEWPQLFDVIITQARKPKFFYEASRPFRSFSPKTGVRSWKKVEQLKKGFFYQEGNFYRLRNLTGWYGHKVLYFGDHVYTDLADVTLKHGWRTGAIIPELADEIGIINSPVYKENVYWLKALEDLISRMQVYDDAESRAIVAQWLQERRELRLITKNIFNPQFGSLFRTYHNPTYFTRRLNRFADLYMSSITNLLQYPQNHSFYPRRSSLPHELQD